ncbi:MAG: hypothetical protein OHK0022_29350 [Roseiflexaceae bacterium]
MTHQRISYQSLDIEIGPGQGRDYPAKARGPGGEAAGTFRLPFGPSELDSRLKDVQIALLRATGRRRTVLSPQEQAVRDFGRALFEALFPGELRGCYDRSLLLARQQNQGLRIRLRIQPPELLPLPWEFLYDPSAGEYLCLSRHTPLVRYVELPHPTQPLAVTLPLRVLALAAGPKDQPPLDLAGERKRLERAVEPLRARGLVELHWLEGATWRDLRRAVLAEPWHVFHFIGHGGFSRERDEGFLALCDDHGETFRLNATHLARLLADQRALRLVILNSCEGARSGGQDEFSSTASILVRRGIPAVIAMQEAITDTAGIEFAQSFYEALAEGLPIDTAVADARIAISVALGETLEWSVPVLFLRAEDGVLFEVGESVEKGKKSHGNSSVTAQAENSESDHEPSLQNVYKAQDTAMLAEEYYQRSINFINQRHFDQAIAELSRAIAEQPYEAKYYRERGVSYSNKGEDEYAIADYDRAIQIDPNQADYYYCRGVSYSKKGNHDLAIVNFDFAIQIDPNKAYYYRERGVSYHNSGKYDQAIMDYDQAIKLDPNNADFYNVRGIAYKSKGDRSTARRDFEQAVALGLEKAKENIKWVSGLWDLLGF